MGNHLGQCHPIAGGERRFHTERWLKSKHPSIFVLHCNVEPWNTLATHFGIDGATHKKKGDGCHALFGCQNSKSRRHLHAHFGSGRGHLLLKIVYNNYLSICALNTQTQTMYTRSICLYVHMCYMYMHVLTHCRYPHIQILHCKVPYSPVHQGDPWAVPQHCDECGKFLSLATWTDRARERERGREIPWDTPEQRKAGRKAGKKGGRGSNT